MRHPSLLAAAVRIDIATAALLCLVTIAALVCLIARMKTPGHPKRSGQEPKGKDHQEREALQQAPRREPPDDLLKRARCSVPRHRQQEQQQGQSDEEPAWLPGRRHDFLDVCQGQAGLLAEVHPELVQLCALIHVWRASQTHYGLGNTHYDAVHNEGHVDQGNVWMEGIA
eukprot:CAMPEP_0171088006 /NCGR_PEP_ID=MMETSP0766_2-20121228/20508_1 /TAXON_ID=439317 /ORGANISM="Gambierdiscus australes, Strain CAWD 149" /LENGTH=169 /DNA_ID=CAMNT_0011545755 /DNA_START=26 /DNA_END=531 /DNA_ORIENTATION=-